MRPLALTGQLALPFIGAARPFTDAGASRRKALRSTFSSFLHIQFDLGILLHDTPPVFRDECHARSLGWHLSRSMTFFGDGSGSHLRSPSTLAPHVLLHWSPPARL